jgi:hypothetical protein
MEPNNGCWVANLGKYYKDIKSAYRQLDYKKGEDPD